MEHIKIGEEELYLKKNKWLGWSVVNPIKNSDGTINWLNLLVGGNWVKFFLMVGMVLIFLGLLTEYASVIKVADECLNNQIIFKL